jgi:hypothetical protein
VEYDKNDEPDCQCQHTDGSEKEDGGYLCISWALEENHWKLLVGD